jgi:chromosome partitioning protein
MKIVAVANQKGGTGKTTTVVNLAAALSRAGHTSLLVDLDPQASLTEYFQNPAKLEATIYNGLLDSVVSPLQLGDSITLLPSNIDLAAAEVQLPAKRNQERTLSRLLRNYQADYCLIDCPPSLGVLTTNALTAAYRVLIPVSTELMAERTVKLILSTIEEIREIELNPGLQVWRLLPTIYDARLAHHREVLEALRTKYADIIYPDPVRATTKYKDAVTATTDVSDMDTKLGSYWDQLAAVFIQEV